MVDNEIIIGSGNTFISLSVTLKWAHFEHILKLVSAITEKDSLSYNKSSCCEEIYVKGQLLLQLLKTEALLFLGFGNGVFLLGEVFG